VFGFLGIATSAYFYLIVYPSVYQSTFGLSGQLLLASQNLESLSGQKLLSGELSTQINSMVTNLSILNTNMLQTAQHFTSLGSSFNICIFQLCPFNSVSSLFYSLANTTSSASETVSSTSVGLSSLTNLTVGDVLTPQQSGILNSASGELYNLAKVLNSTINLLPYLMLYAFGLNFMFFIIGLGMWFITSELGRLSSVVKRRR
jgi:hypothetical protein